MKQIAVTKITKTTDGEVRRNMMLDQDIWDKVVAGDAKENHVRWELRKVEPVVTKEAELIADDTKEVELVSTDKKEDKETEPVVTKEAPKKKKRW